MTEIVREMASLADGMTMSAKKDPMGNIGGWLAMDDDELARACRNLSILTKGSRRTAGWPVATSRRWRRGCERSSTTTTCAIGSARRGISARRCSGPECRCSAPVAGTPVYLDARALLPQIPPLAYPGQALAVALYEAGGVRSCEIGTVMFGRQPDGTGAPAALDLVRLAIPRRTYTQSHIDYVIEVCEHVARGAGELTGYRIVDEPAALRHFTATFEPLA